MASTSAATASLCAALRAELPAIRSGVHLNAAGASLQAPQTLKAVTSHLALEAEVGGYEALRQAGPAVEKARASLAKLVGGKPEEIAFLDSNTRAWQLAFYSLAADPRQGLKPGDRVLFSQQEYASNLISGLQVAEKADATVRGGGREGSARRRGDATRAC